MQVHDQNLAEQLRDVKQQLEQLQSHGQPAGLSSQCVQLRIPKFNKTNPQLWFSQLDRLFHLHNVTDDNKFDIISVNLEEDVIAKLEDLIASPPLTNKYATLKQRVLDKFAESPDSKLKRLLRGGETVGKKPSDILDHMRRLAPTTGCEAVIRSLFLAELPNSIRPLISVWDENNLDKLAEIADKMLEASEPGSAFVESTALPEQQHQVDVLSGKQTGMSEVTSALRALTTKVDKLQGELRQSKHAQLSRHPHDSSNDVGSKLCFYHTRFGENARKCQPACPRYQSSN
ncbi:uncharacterized protein LOC133847746 [Drosophila sulfurigaster albostrigata]|uniref:uncharacterized protein LOC133847746 n=1 Tax=Drosophila sulfurigaster albostrigata TaxID=89887 RepID=UPI002D21CA03|nr:uncharacterized protein LOC133847746 [Drosophila sulfurigaster albostrigata]